MGMEPTPNAGPRKNVTNNRRRKKTTILTESPWRNAIAAFRTEREKKKLGRDKKKGALPLPPPPQKKKKKKERDSLMTGLRKMTLFH